MLQSLVVGWSGDLLHYIFLICKPHAQCQIDDSVSFLAVDGTCNIFMFSSVSLGEKDLLMRNIRGKPVSLNIMYHI